ncbi:head-tail connector protein [Aureimonas glaciei]|uniref:Phage gp6-like head-tail connector protein n=1 Tax=Aureimonas glaciei TaxID=1776957 RepID=A0A916Y4Y7_9HYPH|nr:phage head-tail connector protein [Aureimonas glaciei]GGD30807.1 hypothetical protein GCM10011335_37290 [Aureimonas glaciei]
MRHPVLITAPEELPVTLEAVKQHLRIEASVTEDDAELQEKIAAATQALDGYSGALGRALVTQTWQMQSSFCGPHIRLPLAPIQSVVITYDDAGDPVTVDTIDYQLLSDGMGWVLRPLTGSYWPTITSTDSVVTVTFVAGYGAPADVPSDIRLAIMLDVEMAYDRPEGERFKALRQQYRDIVDRNRRISI